MPNDNICLLYFMGTLLRERFVALGWGARNLCHVCVSAIPKPKEENNERSGGGGGGMKAVRRSRGKFTTLNAFARRSEVEVGGDGADSGKETSYSTYYMDVLW